MGHDAGGDTRLGELLAGRDGQLDFEPVPMSTTSGLPFSASTGRSRQRRPSADVPSSTGTFWRVSARPAGRFRRVSTVAQAWAVSFASAGAPRRGGDGAKRGEVLDRLVGRAVLAEADGVVGPHVDRVDLHQRGQAHRRTHVVGELQERPAVGWVGPCSTMPDRIAPIACSRMPKCRVRPYGSAPTSTWRSPSGRRTWRRRSSCCWSRRGRPSRPTAPAGPGRGRRGPCRGAARGNGLAGFPGRECIAPTVRAVRGRADGRRVPCARGASGPGVEAGGPTRRGRWQPGSPAHGYGRSRRRRR